MHTYTVEILSRLTRECLRETRVEAISSRQARVIARLYCRADEEPGQAVWED